MNPMDQSRRRKFQPNGGRGCLLLSGLVLMTLAGCNSDFGSRRQSDPLLGIGSSPTDIHSSPTPVPPANTPGSASSQTALGEPTPPPLPASYTAAGSAAVAAGETATPVPARNLRIGDPIAPASVTGNSAARGAAPAVTVGSPEPAGNGSTSRLAPVPPAASAGQTLVAPTPPIAEGAGVTTFDQAQRLLKQYGVTWQRIYMDDGLWKFQCGIPKPSAPNVNRTYATTKGAPDYMSAICEVIAQIEKERH